MHIYVANYVTTDEFYAELDDPCARDVGLEGWASPQFLRMTASMTDEWVEVVKAEVQANASDGYMDEEEYKGSAWSWQTDGWVVPDEGREHQVFRLFADDELMAVMVVQKQELDA